MVRNTNGLVKFDNNNWTVYDTTNNILPTLGCSIITCDNSNNIWIASNGVLKFNGTVCTEYNTSNSGIPSNYTYDLYADRDTIWISTGQGLTKYDGSTWTVFNTSNSNISGTPLFINKDSIGNLWFAYGSSIEKFDGSNFTLYNSSNSNIPSSYITSLAIDQNNVVYFGNLEHLGQDLFDNIIGNVTSFNGSNWVVYDTSNTEITDPSIYSIFIDNNNSLWAGGKCSGKIFNKIGSQWIEYNPSIADIEDRNVRDIIFDSYNNTYIGSGKNQNIDEGLTKFDMTNWNHLGHYNDTSLAFTVDKFNNVLVKNRHTIQKYNGTNWTTIWNIPDCSTPINSELNEITTDSTGDIWMDYYTYAVYDPLSSSYIFKEGIAHYNGLTWTTYNNTNSPFTGNIHEIKPDLQNKIWVGGSNGLFKFDGTNWNQIQGIQVLSFAFDSLNNVWFSDGHFGLYKYDGITTEHYIHPTMSGYFCPDTDIEIDNHGNVYQATQFSFIVFDGTNWVNYDETNSPLEQSTNLNCLTIDKYGNKWIGTSYGIMIFNEGGMVTNDNSNTYKSAVCSVKTYPNPFSGQTTFEIINEKANAEYSVDIYDMLGKHVKSMKDIYDNTFTLSAKGLESGIYTYKVLDSEKEIGKGKIIVE